MIVKVAILLLHCLPLVDLKLGRTRFYKPTQELRMLSWIHDNYCDTGHCHELRISTVWNVNNFAQVHKPVHVFVMVSVFVFVFGLWSGYVSSPLWLNVFKVPSLKDCSFRFSLSVFLFVTVPWSDRSRVSSSLCSIALLNVFILWIGLLSLSLYFSLSFSFCLSGHVP